jgi:dihydrofolate reductase
LRRRLVVTRSVPALAPDPANAKALLWNPSGASFEEAMTKLGVSDGVVGVIGGTDVFGMFLGRYDVFYLTRAPSGNLPRGRPVFPGVPGETPEQILARYGYVAAERGMLDAANGVVVTSWRRDAGASRSRPGEN